MRTNPRLIPLTALTISLTVIYAALDKGIFGTGGNGGWITNMAMWSSIIGVLALMAAVLTAFMAVAELVTGRKPAPEEA